MNIKIYNVLNKIYAILMCISFFAGFVPVIPFIIALCVGGETGKAIYGFFFNKVAPIIIALGSLSVIVGVIAMYTAKIKDLSLDSVDKK